MGFGAGGGAGVCAFMGGVLFVFVLLSWFSFEAHEAELSRRSTRMTRIKLIFTDSKSARIRVIA